jgi:hypothetical protein
MGEFLASFYEGAMGIVYVDLRLSNPSEPGL